MQKGRHFISIFTVFAFGPLRDRFGTASLSTEQLPKHTRSIPEEQAKKLRFVSYCLVLKKLYMPERYYCFSFTVDVNITDSAL